MTDPSGDGALQRRHVVEERAWGDHEPAPVAWTSGAWSLLLRGDELADIRFDDAVVIRSIRGVARDRDWATLDTTVAEVEATDASLAVHFRMSAPDARLDAVLTVTADGEALQIALGVTAVDAFWRNRLGLVVLHPPTVAGRSLEITHPSGRTEQTVFPERIAPHQPAIDIAALHWTTDELDATLEFAGDVFEMEDQRNWTDASFKTYSTPLSLPFPVRVGAGERVTQSVTLTCARVGTASRPVSEPIALRRRSGPAPRIGVLAAPGSASSVPLGGASSATPIGGVLVVELTPDSPGWRDAWAAAVVEAGTRALDLRIVTDDPARIGEVLDAVATDAPRRIGVFSASSHVTEPPLFEALIAEVARHGIRSLFVGGARSHFTELNREQHRLPPGLPALTVSMTPQMHATGRHQLVESIAMQRLVADETVRIAAGRPAHIGPVTLRPRFNAVATSEQPAVADPDPRQRSEALGAWLAASHAALAVDGVDSITWFEGAGHRGYGDAHGDFPAAAVARILTGWAGLPALAASGSGTDLWITGVERGPDAEVVVANLASDPAAVELEWNGITHRVEVDPLGWVHRVLPSTA